MLYCWFHQRNASYPWRVSGLVLQHISFPSELGKFTPVNKFGKTSKTREVLLRGRLSTFDLLVLTSLYQLVFILKILFSFFTKQSTLMRKSTSTKPSPSVSFPCPIICLSTFPVLDLCRSVRQFQKTLAYMFVAIHKSSEKLYNYIWK